MPLFEYECKKCKNHFEILVLDEKDSDIKCPKCMSKDIQKQFSAFSSKSSSSKCEASCDNHTHHCCGNCCHNH